MKRTIVIGIALCLLAISGVNAQQKDKTNISANNVGVPGNEYKTLTPDGVWCWFSDPRAVSINDKIYSGWVTNDGSIVVSSYNKKSGEKKQANIYPQFNKDDHANPSFIILPDKRLMVFFSAHSTTGRGEKEPAISYLVSKNPEDITEWGELQRITQNAEGPMAFCYTNPIILPKEDNRIYVFWRGGDWKPTFCYSDDYGKTWTKIFSLIKSSENKNKRPYMKVSSNGKDEIHFAFTDGHPRNEPLNSIYYLKYKKGKFYKADGTLVGTMKDLPLEHQTCDIVYDSPAHYKSSAYGIRAWIWDIAIDENGAPVLAYTKLPTESQHQYWYAKWTGKEWLNSKISNAGSWFPRYEKTKSQGEPEPHYSGGISIDHENTNVVYYSKPVGDVFEIFKSETFNDGKQWSETAITKDSKKDNVRPFAIRNSAEESENQVMWMLNNSYVHYMDYDTQIKIDAKKGPFSAELTHAPIKDVMKAVADWQVSEKLQHALADWTNGALYAGMVEWAKIADDSLYFNYLRNIGDKLKWAHYMRSDPTWMYFADDYAVGHMYVEMHREFGEEKMIKPLTNYFNYILRNPSKCSLEFKWDTYPYPIERWSWCDALFMGPTVWAKMAKELNRKDYLEFMHKEYMACYDYLFDEKEDLFFRDDTYFAKKEANGEKIFWGRGNGWVVAGLPIIIKELSDDWQHKKFYETLFVRMAEKIASLQDENGYWHASLLDPDSYPNPETSSSAFFTYALAWGVNNGYLNKEKYQPVVEKAWKALVKAVYPNGKLGWVQPIGADPKAVTQDMTEVYGVGAFLLAGTEMYKLVSE